MKVYRMLQRDGRKAGLSRHFEFVVGYIESTCRLDSGSTNEADCFAQEYLASNINRKAVSPYGENYKANATKRRAEALTGFLARELVNRRINETEIFGYSAYEGDHRPDDTISLDVLLEARRLVALLLGDSPSLSQAAQLGDYGSGASVSLVRKNASRPNKFTRGICVTKSFARAAGDIVSAAPAWADSIAEAIPHVYYTSSNGQTQKVTERSLQVCSWSDLDFVDKDKSIDRIIMKEPELNGFIQKGIGAVLRNRLRKGLPGIPGIDLNSSGSLNSELARYGSIENHLATIDSERASDSISLALCEFLLPEDWYNLLLTARTPYTVLPNGVNHRLQMMAGMGNGFCFELESVIFYCIGVAACKRSALPFAEWTVSIHGDDLVVPADVAITTELAFRRAGVIVNKKKSFADGPFRESCGGHFYNGLSVKPFYRKGSTGLTRGDWFWLANSLLLWLSERSPTFVENRVGQKLIQVVKYLRDYSSNYGDDWNCPSDRGRRAGLWSPPQLSRGASYKQRLVVSRSVDRKSDDAGAYVAWLHTPVCSPTVLELLKREDEGSVEQYELVESREQEKWVRFNEWAPLPVGCEHILYECSLLTRNMVAS